MWHVEDQKDQSEVRASGAPAGRALARVEVSGDGVRVHLRGRLDYGTVGEVWGSVFGGWPSGAHGGRLDVVVEAAEVTYCDGAGLGLLVELDRRARQQRGTASFHGLAADLTRLLERAVLADPAGPPVAQRVRAIEYIGKTTSLMLADVWMMIGFLGELVAALGWAIAHPRRVRVADTLLVAEKAGANAVPVVCLLGFLMGVIIAFQTAAPLRRFGVEASIPTILAISMVRELGPLITAIILAGRSGSAFAAELGTMKVTEEIDALTTLGLVPARFLVLPRLLAAMVTTPLLNLFATLCGLIGGYFVMLSLGYGLPFYVRAVRAVVEPMDLLQALFKSLVFAFLIASIGCLRGLRTARGPGAVGDSTTRAVVAGIVLVIVADGVMGVVFFYLGI